MNKHLAPGPTSQDKMLIIDAANRFYVLYTTFVMKMQEEKEVTDMEWNLFNLFLKMRTAGTIVFGVIVLVWVILKAIKLVRTYR